MGIQNRESQLPLWGIVDSPNPTSNGRDPRRTLSELPPDLPLPEALKRAKEFHAGLDVRAAGDLEEAKALLASAADAGHIGAMCQLGDMLHAAGDQEAARRWWKQASDKFFELAADAREDRELDAATQWLWRAVEVGHADAMTILGDLVTGDIDWNFARTWMQRLAEAGEAEKLCELVQIWQEDGDKDRVRRWWEEALKGGLPDAAIPSLPMTDLRKAERARLAQIAGCYGNMDARHRLGLLDEQDGNLAGARGHFERAAKGGHSGAMYRLGLLAENAGDVQGAVLWYQKAAAAGHRTARGKLDVI